MPKKKCDKVSYATAAEAKDAIAAMVRKKPGIMYLKAYKCARCKAFHVTSTPPRRGRRIQR